MKPPLRTDTEASWTIRITISPTGQTTPFRTDMLKRPAGRGDARLFPSTTLSTEKSITPPCSKSKESSFYDPHPCDTLYAQKLLCHRATQSMEKGIFEYETEFPEHARQSGYVGMQAAMLYYIIDNHPSAASILDRIMEKGDSGAETVGKAYTLKGIMEAQAGLPKRDRIFKGLISATAAKP